MSKARSHNRTVIAMAALAVLASLALFGGAEAAGFGAELGKIIGQLLPSLFDIPKGVAGDIGNVAGWLIGKLF